MSSLGSRREPVGATETEELEDDMDIVMGKDKDGKSHIHHYMVLKGNLNSMKCSFCGVVYELNDEQIKCDHAPNPNILKNYLFNSCDKCNVPNPMNILTAKRAVEEGHEIYPCL